MGIPLSDQNVNRPIISVVIPAYNEELSNEKCYLMVVQVFDELVDFQLEMVVVNDGSRDQTQKAINRICDMDDRVTCVDLSRNFGKEIAMTAGLEYASGDAIVIMDADLQHPPEMIPKMIAEWHAGFDIVYGVRTHRQDESLIKRTTTAAFYRLFAKMTQIEIPRDAGDFRLMSKRAVNALLTLREHHRFMKGLFAWIGFPSKAIQFTVDPRTAGFTKFSFWKLWNFAIEGITSFTIVPLKIATYVGLMASLIAFSVGGWIIFKTIVWGESVQGYPTLMVSIVSIGGLQLFFIGLLGEYLGRVFNETKRRPLYFSQYTRRSKYTKMDTLLPAIQPRLQE